MATTTNYSWTTPDDTDLVKDGAAAIRTLGSSADTTVKALNPGTTAGDVDYYTTSTAKARLGIGTAGQVLTVNSGATAPEWATPAGAAFVGCRITQATGTNQTISNNTSTDLTFDSETYDTDGFHDNVTNNARITIPAGKGGKYQITGHVEWINGVTGIRNIYIFKNGTSQIATTTLPTQSSDFNLEVNSTADLTAGDYITLQVYQNSGSTRDVYKRTDTTYFLVTYLGA
jgi:hypothetical protein